MLLVLGLACRILEPGAKPQATVFINRLPTITPTPVKAFSIQEAWQQAQPELTKWAVDAKPGDEWTCQGVVTPEGLCTKWYGLVGTASQQKAASLKIEGSEIQLSDTAAIGRAIDNSFSMSDLVDSPIVVQQAMQWLEKQGLRETNTKIRSLALLSNANALKNCGNVALPAVYQVGVHNPQGRVCLDPTNGQVVFSTVMR
ncbi:MAG: hypothetical protein BroJett011_08060 [Chloroflexota bacterium]|nr:MAG: hypothetical protein BroJett011_08060 [Chloroflexota bacterium]